MKFVSITIEQSIDAPIRKATMLVDGLSPPPLNSNILIHAPDHLGVRHCIFAGFAPDQNITRAPAANQVNVTGYDYGYNFATEKWMLPESEYESNVKDWKLDNFVYWCIAPVSAISDNPPSSQTSGLSYNYYTNVYPFRIPSKLHIDLAIGRTFSFTTSRLELLKTLAEDNGCIFHIKPKDVFNTGYYKSALYFIDADDIDSSSLGFQLPAPIEFALDSPYLASPLQIQQNQNRKYNTIILYGSDTVITPGVTGILQSVKQSPAVIEQEERPFSYIERDPNLDTYEKLSARADLLYAYYTSQSDTVIARFVNRVDLELYQKIKFTDLTDTKGNTIGWLRITNIRYILTAGLTMVECECSSRFDLLPKQAIAEKKSITKTIRSVIKDAIKKNSNFDTGELENQLAVITEIDGSLGTAYTDFGKEILNVKLPNQDE